MDKVYLGLDIGGTKSAAVIGDREGRILRRKQVATPQDRSDWHPAVGAIMNMAHDLCVEAEVGVAYIEAIGVSIGGPLDHETGVIYSPPNLPAWDGVPLKEMLISTLGVAKVIVENDANATALAEHRWGAGQGTRHMAFLTMGTGIGAGLILNGELFRGKRDLAGEIGHATVIVNGPQCTCGKRGCLEAIASGTGIAAAARERYADASVTAEMVCTRARAGDEVAKEILAGACAAMGVGLANLLHTLDLERIVLGTLAVKAADLLMEPIREQTRANTWPRIWEGVTIVPAELGDEAQDRAAIAVAML